MKINVDKPYTETLPVTIQYIHADGYVEYCDHAGAEETEMEFVEFTSYDGGAYHAPDDSRVEYVMHCDKCPAWHAYDLVWRTD